MALVPLKEKGPVTAPTMPRPARLKHQQFSSFEERLQFVLGHFDVEQVRGTKRKWKGHSPLRRDANPSLEISIGDDGRILIRDWGDPEAQSNPTKSVEAILAKAGLTLRDLRPPDTSEVGIRPRHQVRKVSVARLSLSAAPASAADSLQPVPEDGRHPKLGKAIAKYLYQDASGKILFRSVRYEPRNQPKTFRQHQFHDGQWFNTVEGVRRVLYRLPELINADPSLPVFIVEGEKDADRLAELGFIATTNVSGAGNWLPEYSEFLLDRDVVILPDNDDKGRMHAQKVANALRGIAKSIRILQWGQQDA